MTPWAIDNTDGSKHFWGIVEEIAKPRAFRGNLSQHEMAGDTESQYEKKKREEISKKVRVASFHNKSCTIY